MHTADNCFRVAHDTPGVRDSCNSRTPSLRRVASRSRKARLTRAGYAFDERTPVEFIMKDTGGPPARRKRKTKPAVSAGRKGASRPETVAGPRPIQKAQGVEGASDSRLEAALRVWRLVEARRRGVPAF